MVVKMSILLMPSFLESVINDFEFSSEDSGLSKWKDTW